MEYEDDEEFNTVNHYCCERCNEEWTDTWSCEVEDDCPHCGLRHMTPYYSHSSDDTYDPETEAECADRLTKLLAKRGLPDG